MWTRVRKVGWGVEVVVVVRGWGDRTRDEAIGRSCRLPLRPAAVPLILVDSTYCIETMVLNLEQPNQHSSVVS